MYSIITPENLESAMDRPSDTPWTEEQNRRYAEGRAETIRLANERAKSKIDGVFFLVQAEWSATFSLMGDVATVTHTKGRGRFAKAEAPITMTRAQARQEWLRLVDAGYTQW